MKISRTSGETPQNAPAPQPKSHTRQQGRREANPASRNPSRNMRKMTTRKKRNIAAISPWAA